MGAMTNSERTLKMLGKVIDTLQYGTTADVAEGSFGEMSEYIKELRGLINKAFDDDEYDIKEEVLEKIDDESREAFKKGFAAGRQAVCSEIQEEVVEIADGIEGAFQNGITELDDAGSRLVEPFVEFERDMIAEGVKWVS